MLSVIHSKRRWRDFLVYDLEWIPGTLEVRLVGVFDGKRYRAYRTVKDFLNNELNHENRGKWFYAHAGGLADVQFLFEHLVYDKAKNYSVKASFSGSSAIIVHVGKGISSRNGEWSNSLGHDVYHFVDSYWLLRDTLRNIGKSIGLEKGGAELSNDGQDDERAKAWFRNVSLAELTSYNEQDCYILWTAIQNFQKRLWDFGGQLQMTLASSAMQLFRRYYLTRDIPTDDEINAIARESYYSSRVEVFAKNCHNSNYYDINSSFPFSMTKPVPGECIGGNYGRLPKAGTLYLADCEVEIPEVYFPTLPKRVQGRVFFPVGKWRGWYNNVDLEHLQDEGGRICKVYNTLSFKPFTDLTHYASALYERRKASKDEFDRYCYKLLLNSLYGKFAESDVKAGVYVNPSAALMATFDPELTQQLLPGVFLHPDTVNVPHVHVPISSHIVSNSRRVLDKFLTMSDDFHYTDTDGFSVGTFYPTSNELGGLKHEKRVRDWMDDPEWHFEAPKLYKMGGQVLKDGKWKNEKTVKAKGFSLGRDKVKAERLFLELVNNGEIQVTRMERVRQLLRRGGDLKPRESLVTKRLQKSMLSKRFFYPDGSTRPWTVKELESAY